MAATAPEHKFIDCQYFTPQHWKECHFQTFAEERNGKDDAILRHNASRVLLDENGVMTGYFIADDMVIAPHHKAGYDAHGLAYLVQVCRQELGSVLVVGS